MAFKVNSNHWEIIVNFMEIHPDLARGRINGPSGKDTFKKLWLELTTELNAIGLGQRTVHKWQKAWTDFKYSLKKKAADIKADISGTGGGPAKGGDLTDWEIRILNLLGKTFHGGLGRSENGVSIFNMYLLNYLHMLKSVAITEFSFTYLAFMNNTNSNSSSNVPDISYEQVDNKKKAQQNETPEETAYVLQNEKLVVLPDEFSSTVNPAKRKLSEVVQIQPPAKRIFATKNTITSTITNRVPGDDHNYTKEPSSIKTKRVNPEREMEVLYKETLSELKDVNSNLKGIREEIALTSRVIEAGINQIANALVIFLSNK